MDRISGKDLISWGYEPAPWFGEALTKANELIESGAYENVVKSKVAEVYEANKVEIVSLREDGDHADYGIHLSPETTEDEENLVKVCGHMNEIMRLPTVVAGAVLPDACPVGQKVGTIPVGGVATTKGTIHPGFHSSDVCCSLAVTVLDTEDPSGIIDAAMNATHFGKGSRPAQVSPSRRIMEMIDGNTFLKPHRHKAVSHFMTQGDGNHFFFVGRMKSTDQICIVTHHGSRALGAQLYKDGLAEAKRHTRRICPEAPSHNSWLDFDSSIGQEYWDALQIVRKWVRENHYFIHDLVMEMHGLRAADRFWNEHNFVFRRGDLFDHAKGATPAFHPFAEDDSGLTTIPLSMSDPILITRGPGRSSAREFAPHGAGRNFGRKEFERRLGHKSVEDVLREDTSGIDVRFYCGTPDISELPSAYKSGQFIRSQIERHGLCEIVDEIFPIGTIMAGHDAPKNK